MPETVLLLDGNDWEADYFLTHEDFNTWKSSPRKLYNMLRNSAISSGFVIGADAPGAMKGTIPGTDRTFLIENGECEDPYYARNLEKTEYSEKYSWAFRKRFTAPTEWKNKRLLLKLKGIDYQALVCVNGEWLNFHKGPFLDVVFDITQQIVIGKENILCLIFSPAPKGLPNHYDDRIADFAKFHRTQIGFGWDWSRGMVPTGINDSVEIIAYDNVHLSYKQVLYDGNKATLKLEIESRYEIQLNVNCQLTPENFNGKVSTTNFKVNLIPGKNQIEQKLELPSDLQLWYPLNSGKQALYNLELSLDNTIYNTIVGFKTVKLTRNIDSPMDAENLTFNINGKDIFVKGVNYVPIDLLQSRVTKADYEYFVALAAQAGVNYFRMWGGGIIEKDYFYELCDRYGIMIHQEFIHACSQYPKDNEYLAFKKLEGYSILKNIANHVSIVLICGGNEVQYFGEIPNSPLLENYRKITSEILPYTPYRISSPDLSKPGERHHGPWNFQEHTIYNGHFRCFCSEIGCNGMPEYSSLQRFIPDREIKAMQGPALEYHFYNRATAHNLAIPLEKFSIDNMEQFCQASMFAQGDVSRYTMEHYRRLSPKASGCVFWQYNEPWPTCSFSIVDYYGVPKQALYALKAANKPLLLSLKDNSWCCKENILDAEWFITTETSFSGALSLKAIDCATGKEIFKRETNGDFFTGTTKLNDIKEKLPEGITAIFFKVNNKYQGVRLYGVPDYKTAFTLPKAKIEITHNNGNITIKNIGNVVAVNLRLSFPQLPDKSVILEDNYITIAPGELRTISYQSTAKEISFLEIDGWNLHKMTI